MAPELVDFVYDSRESSKIDVYSFGVVRVFKYFQTNFLFFFFQDFVGITNWKTTKSRGRRISSFQKTKVVGEIGS